MLLSDVATASAEVGAVSARSAKIARIAALLGSATDDPATVAVVVHWLSGELPQRQIGVGWAALRALPPLADGGAVRLSGVSLDAPHSLLVRLRDDGSGRTEWVGPKPLGADSLYGLAPVD